MFDKLISRDIVKDLTVRNSVSMYRFFERNYQIYAYYDFMGMDQNIIRNSFSTVRGFSKNV